LKVENNLKDYQSFQVIRDKELNQITIFQPHLTNNLKGKFDNEVLEKRTYRTPVTPKVQGNPSRSRFGTHWSGITKKLECYFI
jgi:hypothetical protein